MYEVKLMAALLLWPHYQSLTEKLVVVISHPVLQSGCQSNTHTLTHSDGLRFGCKQSGYTDTVSQVCLLSNEDLLAVLTYTRPSGSCVCSARRLFNKNLTCTK